MTKTEKKERVLLLSNLKGKKNAENFTGDLSWTYCYMVALHHIEIIIIIILILEGFSRHVTAE